MPVQRLNHAVLYVRDVERSVAFYTEALGFRVVTEMPGPGGVPAGRGLDQRPRPRPVRHRRRAGASTAGRRTVGLYHLAWEVDTLAELRGSRGVLAERGALVGASDHGTTKALYAQDPDGIEFEVSWLVPAGPARPRTIDDADPAAATSSRDRRYGAETRGGVGVSVPSGLDRSTDRSGRSVVRHGTLCADVAIACRHHRSAQGAARTADPREDSR